MSFTNFKNGHEIETKVDLKSIDESDLNVLKIYSSDQKEISIPSLIDLVLLNTKGKSIKSENYDELKMFNMVDVESNITEEAKAYLESSSTKERLNSILKD